MGKECMWSMWASKQCYQQEVVLCMRCSWWNTLLNMLLSPLPKLLPTLMPDPKPNPPPPPPARATPVSEQHKVLFLQLLEHSVQDFNRLLCFRNFWNCGIWRCLFLLVHEDHVFSVI